MKKRSQILSLVLVLALLVSILPWGQLAIAAPEEQAQFIAPRLVVNSSFLNIRSGPGIQYPVLLTVVGGTELPVIARSSDNVWFQVSTVIGVGWVNVQYTVPRGSFDNVPVVSQNQIFASSVLPSTAITLGLPDGQGGGFAAPVIIGSTTSFPSTTPVTGGRVVVDLGEGRVTTVNPGERFRATINVEAVNLRTQPQDGAPTLGTLFRDETNDYSILGEAKDKNGTPWVAIEVAELGVGWVEAPKVLFRLSRVAGTVVVLRTTTALTDAPNGSGDNLPVLSEGREGFLVNISRDSNFVQIQLGDGTTGWVPFSSVVTRTGTPSDMVDPDLLPSMSTPISVVPAGTTTGIGVIPVVVAPPSFGLDTPHIIINTSFLNIRSGPGAQYTIVSTISGGAELRVLGIAKDRVWYLVEGGFGRGWVNSEFTLFRGSIDSVPVIHDAIGVTSVPTASVAAGVVLYAAPGTNFGAIGALPNTIEVPIVARTADFNWVQINTSLGFGWVPANQVIVRGDASLIPIVG